MATANLPPTYEQLVDDARDQSRRSGRYAAVVEVVAYMQMNPRVGVMVSDQPIRSRQRGNCFVGVNCQFRDGEPFDAVAPKPTPDARTAEDCDDGLPF